MPARVHAGQCYCPQCGMMETVIFEGKRLVPNDKWRLGFYGGTIFHARCKRPCLVMSSN